MDQTDLNNPLDVWKAYIRALQKLHGYDEPEYHKVPPILRQYTKEMIENLSPYDVEALEGMNAIPKIKPVPVDDDDLLEARAYINNLHRLKGTQEFGKVPAVLRMLKQDEIDNLDATHLNAYRMMNVFPDSMTPNGSIDAQELAKTEAALRTYCECDPELSAMIHDPKLVTDINLITAFANHPKIQAFYNAHPDFKAVQDKERARIAKLIGLPAAPPSSGGPYMSHPYGTPETPSRPQIPPMLHMDPRIAEHIKNQYLEGAAHMQQASTQMLNRIGEVFRRAGG